MKRPLGLVAFIGLLGCAVEDGPYPVDDRPLCPAEQACFRGLVHADCGGETATLRCLDSAVDRCLWIDAPCALPTYVAGAGPSRHAEAERSGWYTLYWGLTPWSRDTEMNVEVVEVAEPAIAPADATIECVCETVDGAAGPCLSGSNDLCHPDAERGVALIRRDAWRPENGTLAWFVGPILRPAGYELVSEVDIERRRARVCLIGYHDAYMSMPDPQCAAAGRVALSTLDPDRLAAGQVDLTLHAEFERVESTSGLEPDLETLTIRLRIPAGRPSLSTRPSP